MNRRLLYVVNSPGFFVSHRLDLARAAAVTGLDVGVASPDGTGVEAIRAAGLSWFELSMDRSGRNPFGEAALVSRLIALYRRVRPSIVHHVTIKPVLYGTLAARITGVPTVINAISGMGFLFTEGRPMLARAGTLAYRALLRHPHMTVIVQNEEDRRFFAANRLVDVNRITLIPGSGVDLARFDPTARRAEPPIVVHTSRMLADKGVREFIAAARMLRLRYPRVRFVLVGAPDPGNPTTLTAVELEAAAREGVIEWWGQRDDVPAILAQASIYALATYYREGVPKSLIEAAAAGLPLIVGDVGGGRELVRDGVNGFVIPVRDAPALAAKIARLLADPAEAARLGRAARADAEARFGIDRINAAQLALYVPAAARIASTNRANR